MDSFDVVISPKALSQLNHYIDYVQYTLLNDQAAYNVWKDAMETRDQLSKVAGSLTPSSHPLLKKNGYRIISFQRHRYLMVYRLEDQTFHSAGFYCQKSVKTVLYTNCPYIK